MTDNFSPRWNIENLGGEYDVWNYLRPGHK